MGWLTQEEFDRLKREVEAIPAAGRLSLTWEEASRYVAADTLELAHWTGLRRRNDPEHPDHDPAAPKDCPSPYEALLVVKNITVDGWPPTSR